MATMSQAHLTQYLSHVKTLPGLTVALRQSDAEAEIPVSLAGLETTVRLFGTFAPSASGAAKIDFIDSGARIGPVPVPAALVNLALREVNPLLDLSKIKVPVTVQEVQVDSGRIVLRGAAQIPTLNE